MFTQARSIATTVTLPGVGPDVPASRLDRSTLRTTPPITFAAGQTVILSAFNEGSRAIPVQIALVDLQGELLDFCEVTLEAYRGVELPLMENAFHSNASDQFTYPGRRRGVVGILGVRRDEPSRAGGAPSSVGLSIQIVDLETGRTQGFWGNPARA